MSSSLAEDSPRPLPVVSDRIKRVICETEALEKEIQGARVRVLKSGVYPLSSPRQSSAPHELFVQQDLSRCRSPPRLHRDCTPDFVAAAVPPCVISSTSQAHYVKTTHGDDGHIQSSQTHLAQKVDTDLRLVKNSLSDLCELVARSADWYPRTNRDVFTREERYGEFTVKGLERLSSELDTSIKLTQWSIRLCHESGERYRESARELAHGWREQERLWREDELLLMQLLRDRAVPIPPLL